MELILVGSTYSLDQTVLQRVAKAAFSYLQVADEDGTIELKMISERAMQILNREYRGIDKATDVLSFNISDKPLAGQIVICYTYTVKQARAFKKKTDDEFALLLVHGILHILGHDHLGVTETARMQDVERKILNLEGIAR